MDKNKITQKTVEGIYDVYENKEKNIIYMKRQYANYVDRSFNDAEEFRRMRDNFDRRNYINNIPSVAASSSEVPGEPRQLPAEPSKSCASMIAPKHMGTQTEPISTEVTISVGTQTDPIPPITISVGTQTEPIPTEVTISVGTQTESIPTEVTTNRKDLKDVMRSNSSHSKSEPIRSHILKTDIPTPIAPTTPIQEPAPTTSIQTSTTTTSTSTPEPPITFIDQLLSNKPKFTNKFVNDYMERLKDIKDTRVRHIRGLDFISSRLPNLNHNQAKTIIKLISAIPSTSQNHHNVMEHLKVIITVSVLRNENVLTTAQHQLEACDAAYKHSFKIHPYVPMVDDASTIFNPSKNSLKSIVTNFTMALNRIDSNNIEEVARIGLNLIKSKYPKLTETQGDILAKAIMNIPCSDPDFILTHLVVAIATVSHSNTLNITDPGVEMADYKVALERILATHAARFK